KTAVTQSRIGRAATDARYATRAGETALRADRRRRWAYLVAELIPLTICSDRAVFLSAQAERQRRYRARSRNGCRATRENEAGAKAKAARGHFASNTSPTQSIPRAATVRRLGDGVRSALRRRAK